MRPIKFSEVNGSLARPDGTTKEECGLLPVYRDDRETISCWMLTEEDLKEILKTRRIWLRVMGQTHPPLHVDALSPFRETDRRTL